MINRKKNTCKGTKNSKCLLCKQRSLNSNVSDIILNEDSLDLIAGGMDPGDLQKVMRLAAADMDLEELMPITYFQE